MWGDFMQISCSSSKADVGDSRQTTGKSDEVGLHRFKPAWASHVQKPPAFCEGLLTVSVAILNTDGVTVRRGVALDWWVGSVGTEALEHV